MRRHVPTILLLVCGVALGLGIFQLVALRFEVGDVYPEYSSLRSDPLGTMAFYESLGGLDGLTVDRDFSTAGLLPDADGTTYLHIATSVGAWREVPKETFEEIEKFVNLGGRLVITMFPRSVEPRTLPSPIEPESEEPKRKVEPSLWERWHLTPRIVDLEKGEGGVYEPEIVDNVSALELPEELNWHSGIVFSKLEASWQPIYVRGEDAVLIERTVGRGSIVIATDSFFLSNEAMQAERHADLLAWLMGPNRRIVFDEAHLGVTESAGVATLMRRYRLHWFMAALILLAGLFVWKNASSLVPSGTRGPGAEYVAGRDAFAGFVNLLRRSVPTREIFQTCYAEWRKSAAQSGPHSPSRLAQAEAAFAAENAKAPKERDAVGAYQTIARILHTRTK